jgi:RNA polymerase sigma factor (sigma-70 family)
MQQEVPPLVVMAGAVRLDPQRLCRLYADQVFRFAAMVSNGNSDAEDLAQEALEHAIRAIDRYDSRRGTVEAWLWRIVVNVARDRGRVERRGRLLVERLSAFLPGQEAAADLTIDAALPDEELLGAVRSLPRRSRTLIALRYGADLEYAEIGAALGMSAAAAGVATRRALADLRRLLESKPRRVG